MWCCSSSARFLLDSIIGSGDVDHVTVNANSGGVTSSKPTNDVSVDSVYLGSEVVVVKNGLRVCGKGGALGSAPLIQTKSYFEVKVQQGGQWAVGVATRNCSLDDGPCGSDPQSWMLRSTGELFFNQMCVGKIETSIEDGDVIGISFDHIELSFYVNGQREGIAFSNVRGTIYPALYVDEGAVLDLIVDHFNHTPPQGFEKIMKEKSLL